MRPIKFRVWDTLHKKMLTKITVMHFDISEDGVEQVYGHNPTKEATSDARWSANIVMMMFTGLLDAKGREIYEGDIVKQDGYPRHEIVEYRHGVVPSELGRMGICGFIMGWVGEGENAAGGVEVIGNIYENPELVK